MTEQSAQVGYGQSAPNTLTRTEVLAQFSRMGVHVNQLPATKLEAMLAEFDAYHASRPTAAERVVA